MKPWHEANWEARPSINEDDSSWWVYEDGGIAHGPFSEADAKAFSSLPDMARALLAVEWRTDHRWGEIASCPSCRGIQPTHSDNCPLNAALQKAGIR